MYAYNEANFVDFLQEYTSDIQQLVKIPLIDSTYLKFAKIDKRGGQIRSGEISKINKRGNIYEAPKSARLHKKGVIRNPSILFQELTFERAVVVVQI